MKCVELINQCKKKDKLNTQKQLLNNKIYYNKKKNLGKENLSLV